MIREGFYLDDLDAEGEDVPEVKLVTTLEAGAGVCIGIVTAGLKGGVTLTINLDLNDPDDDGQLRTAEIRDAVRAATPTASSTRAPTIEAFISVFVEIELLFTSLELGVRPPPARPVHAVRVRLPERRCPTLVSVSGERQARCSPPGNHARSSACPDARTPRDDYEVRQFDTGDGPGSGTTAYEVSGVRPRAAGRGRRRRRGGYASRSTSSGDRHLHRGPGAHVVAARRPGLPGRRRRRRTTSCRSSQGETFDRRRRACAGHTASARPCHRLTGGPGNDAPRHRRRRRQRHRRRRRQRHPRHRARRRPRPPAGPATTCRRRRRPRRPAGGDGQRPGPGRSGRRPGERRAPATTAWSADLDATSAPCWCGRRATPRTRSQTAGPRSASTAATCWSAAAGADSVDGGDGSDVVVGGDAPTLTGGDVRARCSTTAARTVNVLTRGPRPTRRSPAATVAVDHGQRCPARASSTALCESGTLVVRATAPATS